MVIHEIVNSFIRTVLRSFLFDILRSNFVGAISFLMRTTDAATTKFLFLAFLDFFLVDW